MSHVRLLPFAHFDGPHNMAADEVLLLGTIQGQPSLRFYGWSSATLSLGYFQPVQARFADPRLASLPFVRRPTGGATLVHHHELTYALALPADLLFPPLPLGEGPGVRGTGPQTWMPRMHGIFAQALKEFGIGEKIAMASRLNKGNDVLCFQQHAIGDLLCGPCKVLGSAQRKHRQCLLQHGGLLLARSEFTPMLPGIKDLTGVELPIPALMETIIKVFQETTGWRLVEDGWKGEEKKAIEDLVTRKYGTAEWNEKR